MCLHHFIMAKFFVVVNLFTKFDNIGWIDSLFVIKVSYVSHTSKMFLRPLWIRIRAMESLILSIGMNRWSSTLLNRWRENRKLSSFNWIDSGSAIAWFIGISAKPTLSITSRIRCSIVIEWFPIDFIISSC